MRLKTLKAIIKEELNKLEMQEQATLDAAALESVVNKIIKKLDSIDMSLDMIYGSISGADPLTTKAQQTTFGRLATPKPQQSRTPVTRVASEAQYYDLIRKEVIEEFLGFGAKAKEKRLIKQLKKITDPEKKQDIYDKLKSSNSKMAKALAKAAEIMWPEFAKGGGEDSSATYKQEPDRRAKLAAKYAADLKKRGKETAETPAEPAEAPGEETEAAPEEAKPESKPKRRELVKPEKGKIDVYRAAGRQLKGAFGGGFIDQKTIDAIVLKTLQPYIAKMLKARGIEGIAIKEQRNLNVLLEYSDKATSKLRTLLPADKAKEIENTRGAIGLKRYVTSFINQNYPNLKSSQFDDEVEKITAFGAEGRGLAQALEDLNKKAEPEKPAAPEPEKPAAPEPEKLDKLTPVPIFKGNMPLYKRLLQSLIDRTGANSPEEKEELQQVVKMISKDLARQLKANGVRISENRIMKAWDNTLDTIGEVIDEMQNSQ